MKLNCWEVMDCGRYPGGRNVTDLGVCPAATFARANGINGGKNGGRICWTIPGVVCDEKIHGYFANKPESCLTCSFYRRVKDEEGKNFRRRLPAKPRKNGAK